MSAFWRLPPLRIDLVTLHRARAVAPDAAAAPAPPAKRGCRQARQGERRQAVGVKRPAQPAAVALLLQRDSPATPPRKRRREDEAAGQAQFASGKKRRRQEGAAAGAAAQQQQFATPEKKQACEPAARGAERSGAGRLREFQEKFPLSPGLQESWLVRRVLANGDVRWRCQVCDQQRCDQQRWHPSFEQLSVRPEQARLSNLRRHAESKFHTPATKAYLEGQVNGGVGAPPPEDFQAVWHRLGGRSTKRTFSGRKTATIEWCIFQAVREKEHALLAGANTIAVAMDERNDRLLVTYAACRGTTVSSGVLAHLRSPGRSADLTAACVAAAARRFCTVRDPHPNTNKVSRAGRTVKAATLQHILDHVEMFSADGAANEQLAGRLLHPLVQRSCKAAVKLKNLKMVLRDKAHSARRLTMRTFAVDPKLEALHSIMLSASPPIAKMSRYSRPCQEVFEQALRTQRQPRGAESARLAGQRAQRTWDTPSSASTTWPAPSAFACGIWMP